MPRTLAVPAHRASAAPSTHGSDPRLEAPQRAITHRTAELLARSRVAPAGARRARVPGLHGVWAVSQLVIISVLLRLITGATVWSNHDRKRRKI